MTLLKRVLNRSGDIFFVGPFFDAAWVNRLKGKAICLCYHRVDDPGHQAFLTDTGYPAIRPGALAEDLRFLKQKGFDFITLADWRKSGKLDPDRPHAIVTFDDCFKDNYSNSLPVLEEVGARGVFFQVSSMVDSPNLLWEHAVFWHCHDASRARRFTELARRALPGNADVMKLTGLPLAFHLVENLAFNDTQKIVEALHGSVPQDQDRRLASEIYPTKNDLVRAHSAGHEVATHGHLHYKRVNVSADIFEKDLVASIAAMRSFTGEAPLSYAYPHGNFIAGDETICAKYFKHVATVDRGVIDERTNPLELPRFYWGSQPKNETRRKRWLLTGTV